MSWIEYLLLIVEDWADWIVAEPTSLELLLGLTDPNRFNWLLRADGVVGELIEVGQRLVVATLLTAGVREWPAE